KLCWTATGQEPGTRQRNQGQSQVIQVGVAGYRTRTWNVPRSVQERQLGPDGYRTTKLVQLVPDPILRCTGRLPDTGVAGSDARTTTRPDGNRTTTCTTCV